MRILEKLPFGHCGILAETISMDDEGITYTLHDGREVTCPVPGGVWVGGVQVSGTCDRPYRHIESVVKSMIYMPGAKIIGMTEDERLSLGIH